MPLWNAFAPPQINRSVCRPAIFPNRLWMAAKNHRETFGGTWRLNYETIISCDSITCDGNNILRHARFVFLFFFCQRLQSFQFCRAFAIVLWYRRGITCRACGTQTVWVPGSTRKHRGSTYIVTYRFLSWTRFVAVILRAAAAPCHVIVWPVAPNYSRVLPPFSIRYLHVKRPRYLCFDVA